MRVNKIKAMRGYKTPRRHQKMDVVGHQRVRMEMDAIFL